MQCETAPKLGGLECLVQVSAPLGLGLSVIRYCSCAKGLLAAIVNVLCIQDNTVHQLLDRDGMLTVGTEEKDIDWEAMWRTQLAMDDRDLARNGVLQIPLWPLHL